MDDDRAIKHRISPVLRELGIAEYSLQAQTSGQNNDVVTIRTVPAGAELVFRFPRHTGAVEELAREVTLLQSLRGRLPLPIPDPLYVDLRTLDPGQVLMGYRKLPGEPLPRLEEGAIFLTGEYPQRRIADELGDFLVALHAVPLEDFDPPLYTSNERATWERMYADVRSKLFSAMRPDARQEVSVHFESYLDDSSSASWEPALIHGDFGPSNILYDERTEALSGVIDWSSAGIGDPATDLAALIGPVSFGESFAEVLASAYPPLASELPRARFYLGTFALQDALFGLDTGDARAYEAGISQYR
jgi:aminoglycoside 2''-phosphotransferase